VTDPTCGAIAEELVAYLDGEQPASERARIEAHLGTCLTCRRESERLRTVGNWLRALPRVEPGPGLEEGMRRLLEAEPRQDLPRRRHRPLLWSVPALAAAAGVALALSSLLTGGPSGVSPRRQPVPANRGGGADVGPLAGATASRGEVKVAGDMQPALEDVPPEVIEHPELFLRLPVVRRLDKLEHFEEVRRQNEPENVERKGAG